MFVVVSGTGDWAPEQEETGEGHEENAGNAGRGEATSEADRSAAPGRAQETHFEVRRRAQQVRAISKQQFIQIDWNISAFVDSSAKRFPQTLS